MSSYHNTTEDLGYPTAEGSKGGPTVAIHEGREYDLYAIGRLDPTTEVVTFIETGDVINEHGYWSTSPEAETLPQDPSVLEDLPCHWYPEGWEGEGAGEFCKVKPVAMGNGVSGPGFVTMCAEHIKDDRENNRWGFSWWWPCKVSVDYLLMLVFEGDLIPGRPRAK